MLVTLREWRQKDALNTYVFVLGRNPGFPLTFFGNVGFLALMISSKLNSMASIMLYNNRIGFWTLFVFESIRGGRNVKIFSTFDTELPNLKRK